MQTNEFIFFKIVSLFFYDLEPHHPTTWCTAEDRDDVHGERGRHQTRYHREPSQRSRWDQEGLTVERLRQHQFQPSSLLHTRQVGVWLRDHIQAPAGPRNQHQSHPEVAWIGWVPLPRQVVGIGRQHHENVVLQGATGHRHVATVQVLQLHQKNNYLSMRRH